MSTRYITNLYQIFDNVAECVRGPIFQARTDSAAARTFTEALLNEKSELAQHPADFTLIKVGTQDEISGEITSDVTTVVTGRQVIERQKENRDTPNVP